MQWGYSFKSVGLSGVMLANGVIAGPAYALGGADLVPAPSCHFVPPLEWSLGAAVQFLTIGMSGAQAALTTFSAMPDLFLIITTIVAIGLCIAIAHRLWVVRKERDAAWDRVASLETLSERDPLTGLLNRSAVEDRFEILRSQGFDTFALIDLDHFKAVNDRYGHQVGDEVLVACGDALKGGEGRDYLTMRLGGEEFVVLLRGVDAYYRAEALRKRLSLKVTRAVPSLEEPVTASMGLIEMPGSSSEILSFAQICLRAEQLLNSAKDSGRDRTCFERLMVFNDAPPMRVDAQSAT